MIIAIKGYIGVGKSTISEKLASEYDFKVINADKIVTQLYEEKSLQNKIIEVFNLEGFDKKKLAEIVFSSEDELNKLEEIIHPLLEVKMNELIKEYEENILLDCQVIDKLNIEYDYDLLITCPKDIVIKRVMKRDGKTEEQVEEILQAQEMIMKQTKKIFPLDTSLDEEDINNNLKKIMKIFTKDKNKPKYEDDDELYW